MAQKTICRRKYHDGKIWDDIAGEYYEIASPEYHLIRTTPEVWDDLKTVIYSIVCVYSDGSVQTYLFDDLKTAFRVFRNLVGCITISR